MSKFLISLLKFTVFAGVFYIALIILWGDLSPIKKNLRYQLKPDGHTFSRLKELRNMKVVDLLFLGSSHTYRGFDNRIFEEQGYKTFNLGSNSQTPIQTEYLLSNYLDSLNPRIIVFEVCPLVFSLDGVESSLEIISNDNLNKESASLVFGQNHLKVYNTFIYTAYRRLFYQDIGDTEEDVKNNNDTYIKGGFVEIKLLHYQKQKFDTKKWAYNEKQFNSFENIIKMIQKRNIELILVQAPLTSDLYNSYLNNDDFDLEMNKYGKYYNFNETLNLNDSLHFFDFHHLNKYGINVFNREILEILPKK